MLPLPGALRVRARCGPFGRAHLVRATPERDARHHRLENAISFIRAGLQPLQQRPAVALEEGKHLALGHPKRSVAIYSDSVDVCSGGATSDATTRGRRKRMMGGQKGLR